jgi:hypothetical protein
VCKRTLVADFVAFRSNHVSTALALAGNLPKEIQLLQLPEAMAGHRQLRPDYLRGLCS